MARGARALILAGLLVTCDGESGSPEPAVDPPARPPVAAEPEAAPGCEVGEPRPLAATTSPDASVGVTWGERGGWVAVVSRDQVRLRPIDGSGAASGPEVAMRVEGARGLHGVAALEEGALVLLDGESDDGRSLIAVAIDAEGALRTEPARLPVPAEIVTRRLARASDGALFAWSGPGGVAGAARVRLQDRAVSLEAIALLDAPDPELPTEILAAALDGERWAVVWRRGATEDARGGVRISSAAGTTDIEALHEVLVVESVALRGDALSLVAGFEFSRPHAIELGLGEAEPQNALELPVGATPPAPIEAHARGRLALDADGLSLRRTDALGDAIGDRVVVAEGTVRSAALARHGDAFLVVWVDAATRLRSAVARCE